jgi:hypothetical protein
MPRSHTFKAAILSGSTVIEKLLIQEKRLRKASSDARRWKEISVDRLFAAKIVTSGESQRRPAHYLHS